MSAPSLDTRHALHERFARRNRRIGRLRWIVPLLGVAFLAIPLVQIGVSAVSERVGFEGVRLESDTLVIDAPRFEGTTANGNAYAMTAQNAQSRVGDLDTVDFLDLDLDVTGEAGYTAQAFLDQGSWTLSTEQLVSNEDVFVSDSTGASGTLAGVEIDWPAQIIESDGPVRFEFGNGSELVAREMFYDIEAARWRFTRVNLGMTPAPDAGAERDISDFMDAPASNERGE